MLQNENVKIQKLFSGYNSAWNLPPAWLLQYLTSESTFHEPICFLSVYDLCGVETSLQ